MAIRLITTLNKISFIPNSTNSTIIKDFYEYMKANGTSENYQNQNLKAMIVFADLIPLNSVPRHLKHVYRSLFSANTKIYSVSNDSKTLQGALAPILGFTKTNLIMGLLSI